MFKFSLTTLYGACTLFKLLLSIKATPAQADQTSAATQDNAASKRKAGLDSSDDEDHLSEEDTMVTKAATKKVKKKKKTRSKQDDLENHFLKDLSPAQRKLAEATDRKLKNDLDRHKAGPLFPMILPGEMEGTYIFVCRKKYRQLARNVLKGIVPFLTHHLYEPTIVQADQTMGKWIPKSEIQLAQQTLEFLDDVIEDTTDIYQGQLSIDMDMANAKDIDDRKTVTGMLDEMQQRERQLEDAFAKLDALQRQTANHLAISSQSSSNHKVSPDCPEPTKPPKKKKGKSDTSANRARTLDDRKPPPKQSRSQWGIHFQQQTLPTQINPPESQIQEVDATPMDGDTTTAVSQDESQTSSLTVASPGGVHPFFLSPSGNSSDGSVQPPSSLTGRGADRSAAGS
ncbi:unnamed protein product [Cylindrotheca closterium]|uniref:Uncharacterized protein n=1 Tax=Cylindrotheca closterium TaxID=2856 RepID=A0AAD2G404_9STRA|nr:unnamed protein product [Cylindrotheca closterium]